MSRGRAFARPRFAAAFAIALLFAATAGCDGYAFGRFMGAPSSYDDSAADAASESPLASPVVAIAKPRCHGSRDKSPLEYTCADQLEWGKCNETWLIEGGFCAETCGRCSGRVPVEPAASPLAPRAHPPGEGGRKPMPDPGASACGGHIAYEWRIRTDRLQEASGIAASRQNPKVMWSHVDGHTNKAIAFLTDSLITPGGTFGLQGQPVAEVTLPSWVNQVRECSASQHASPPFPSLSFFSFRPSFPSFALSDTRHHTPTLSLPLFPFSSLSFPLPFFPILSFSFSFSFPFAFAFGFLSFPLPCRRRPAAGWIGRTSRRRGAQTAAAASACG